MIESWFFAAKAYFIRKSSRENCDYSRKLPAGLLHAGDLTLIREVSEADTADTVLTHVSMGTAADLATVVLTGGVLLSLLLLEYHCCFSHFPLPPIISQRERP